MKVENILNPEEKKEDLTEKKSDKEKIDKKPNETGTAEIPFD